MNSPDLPPCILCGHTDWQCNETRFGHGTESTHSCKTPGCDGRAAKVFFALALLALFVAPVDGDGYYTIPRDVLDSLAAAEMNECVYCDKVPPTPLLTAKVPTLEQAAFYTGDQEWECAEANTQVDLAELFRLRVEYLREAEARRAAARSKR